MSCRTSSRVFIVLFVLLAQTWFVYSSHLRYGCDNYQMVNIEDCEFGYSYNKCGRYCSAGPFDPCDDVNMKCGSGLSCVCGKCLGCSMETVKCVDPEEEREHRRQCKLHEHRRHNSKLYLPMPEIMQINDYIETLPRD